MYESDMEEKANILVIDDDRDSVAVILKALEPDGYAVFTASNAEMGLIMAKKMRPLLSLVNLSTPGSNGFDLCKSLKDMLHGAPIMLLTTSEGSLSAQYRELYGIVGYFRKPLDAEEILQTARNLLAPVEAVELAQADPSEIDPFAAEDSAIVEETIENVEDIERVEDPFEAEEIPALEPHEVERIEDGEPPVIEPTITIEPTIEPTVAMESTIAIEPPEETPYPPFTPPLGKGGIEGGFEDTVALPPDEHGEEPLPEPPAYEKTVKDDFIETPPAFAGVEDVKDDFIESPTESLSGHDPFFDETVSLTEPVEQDSGPVGFDDFEDASASASPDMPPDISYAEPPPMSPKRKKSGVSLKRVLIPVLALIILAGGGFAAYSLFFRSATPELPGRASPAPTKEKEAAPPPVAQVSNATDEKGAVPPAQVSNGSMTPEIKGATTPAQVVNAPDDGQKDEEAVPPAPPAAVKKYFVQFGIFKSKYNARAYVANLKSEGFNAFIKKDKMKNKTVYRVLMGGYKNKGKAYSAASDIRDSRGLEASVYHGR